MSYALLQDKIQEIPEECLDEVAQYIEFVIFRKKQEQEKNINNDRKQRAKKRQELLASKKYVMYSGRTSEEIDAEIREMRSDRI